MKSFKIALLISLLGITNLLTAQQIELAGFYGYQFNGKLKTYYGKFNVHDNPNFGGILGVEIKGNTFFEFSYDRNDSEFHYSRNGIIIADPAMIATEYYLLGTMQQFGIVDKVKPFAGLNIGMVRFHPKEPFDLAGNGSYSNDAYRFASAFQAGVKYFFSDKLGLRLQGRLLLPMDLNGIFISGGTGGAGGGLSFNIPMVSGGFTAGLVLRIKG